MPNTCGTAISSSEDHPIIIFTIRTRSTNLNLYIIEKLRRKIGNRRHHTFVGVDGCACATTLCFNGEVNVGVTTNMDGVTNGCGYPVSVAVDASS